MIVNYPFDVLKVLQSPIPHNLDTDDVTHILLSRIQLIAATLSLLQRGVVPSPSYAADFYKASQAFVDSLSHTHGCGGAETRLPFGASLFDNLEAVDATPLNTITIN